MSSRTQRPATAQKHRSAAVLGEELSGEILAGGILASLNINVPVVKTQKMKDYYELPSSVVVSRSSCTSNERITRNDNTMVQSFHQGLDDEMSAISCDLSPQRMDESLECSKNKGGTIDALSRQLNNEYASHDSIALESSEDETSEDSSSSPCSREVEVATVESFMGNEKDSESEASESMLDCYDTQCDDDEYNPDDDDDSDTDDDLEFTEEDSEQSPQFKPTRARRKIVESNPGHFDGNAGKIPLKEISRNDDMKIAPSCSDDDSTVIENTPGPKLRRLSLPMTSPEVQLAEVVNDDDETPDDGVLVATIMDGGSKPESEVSSKEQSDTDTILTSRGENYWMAQGQVDGALPQRTGHRMQNSSLRKRMDNFIVHQAEETNDFNPSEYGEQDAYETNASIPNKHIFYQTPIRKKSRSRKKSFYRQEGRVKRGKWTLGAKIGVGSFGVVHVGMNTLTGSLMAVKVFKVDEAVMSDVRSEVELMRLLKHQNIVQYLGAQMDKKHMYIFQEWVPGGSVASMLSRFGAFPLQVIQRYLSQALAGLNYLHENSIMHRDIKGSNILINDEGVVKLADFGASKKLSNLQGDLMMSLTVRGTPYFMAPEVFEEKYSSKADLWGIGCVAYQMITASPPWKDQGFTNPISLFNHIKRNPGPPDLPRSATVGFSKDDPELMHAFDMLMKKCFQKEPSARPSARDLLTHKFFHALGSGLGDDDSHYSILFSPDSRIQSPWSGTCKKNSDDNSSLNSPFISLHHSTNKVDAKDLATKKSQKVPINVLEIDGPPSQSICSDIFSPQRDISDWPEWAKDHLGKQAHDSPSKERELSNMMGSLALSEDSTQQNPFASTMDSRPMVESTLFSNLLGLQLIDGKGINDQHL